MTYQGLMPTAEPFFFPGSGQAGRTSCLLVHGFTGTPKEMRWMGEDLAQRGYTVLGVRLSAHATQPEDMLRSRWHDWLASVEDGWHILSGCSDRIVVMGLSLGGVLALTFAARYPVAGVVAMATPHHLPPDPRLPFIKVLSLLQPFIPKGPSSFYDEEAARQHTSYPVDPTRAYAEVAGLLGEMRAALPRITAPALLIYSRQDQAVTPQEQHMDLIYAALGSTDKHSLWIENSSHVITSDAQRGLVFQAAVDFVAHLPQA
ncbi:MAG: alpha/beta fold hydrolase [Chloroflexota bacterium]